MKDFIELITTLAFILIFVVPFFRKKKKEAEAQKQSSAQTAGNLSGQATNDASIEDMLGTVFELPKTEKKQTAKKQSQKSNPPQKEPVIETVGEASRPAEIETKQPDQRRHPANALLASTSGLRQAILMKEILGKPKGMQD